MKDHDSLPRISVVPSAAGMMERREHLIRILFRWMLVAIFSSISGPFAQNVPERHVVLITIDGFPASMFADAKTHLPRIRKLATEGVSATGMRVSNPSVTWPNHTTLVTGVHPARHSVLFNGILTRLGPDEPVSIDPKRDKSELVAVPTLFDVLHQKRFRTAAINWPCTRKAGTLDDDFPDSPDTLLHTTPRLREELVRVGILSSDKDAAFRALTGAARDDVWTQAAAHVIKQRKPHLLLFHLLNTDGTHHRFGSESSASYTALALADVYVGRVIDALEEAGIKKDTTIIVTADHGFATVKKILQPNVLLRQNGLLQTGASNLVTKARVQVISEGGTGMIYLNNPKTRNEDRMRVLELFEGKEGVAALMGADQFAKLGLPDPDQNKGMADLVLAAKDGYGISNTAVGDDYIAQPDLQSNVGYHGYLASNPKMNAAFIVAGPGVKRGAKIGMVDNVDVAPTIARILGQKLPDTDGRVLTEIFDAEK